MVKKESLGPDEASSHRHVTLDDVARAAGVSKWTVMRILQGKRKNSWRQKQDQARKIIELARQMGYRVNHAARAVRTRRHRTIALLQNLQEGESTINRLFFRGLLEGLDTAGYYLIMATLDKERASSGNMMPRPLS
ncbi:MAG: LacI family transcriptional regulator, partial [Lentisphaerae bacterium]